MKKTFESELPAGYAQIFTIDAKQKKTGLILNAVSFLIQGILYLICTPLLYIGGEPNFDLTLPELMISAAVLVVSLLLYIVLHELTHGAAYKILTKQKLSFGLSWSCAFCGVPNIYVYRGASLLALTAPLILFTIILAPITVWLYFVHPAYYIMSLILLGVHIGGCSGDGYMTLLLLFKFKDKTLLLRDTGPCQWIYTKKNEE